MLATWSWSLTCSLTHLPLSQQQPASRVGEKDTYLAGAPPSVFVHLGRERGHSVNHHVPLRAQPQCPDPWGRHSPGTRAPGSLKTTRSGGVHGGAMERAPWPASQGAVPSVEREAAARSEGWKQAFESLGGASNLWGKTQKDANTATPLTVPQTQADPQIEPRTHTLTLAAHT